MKVINDCETKEGLEGFENELAGWSFEERVFFLPDSVLIKNHVYWYGFPEEDLARFGHQNRKMTIEAEEIMHITKSGLLIDLET